MEGEITMETNESIVCPVTISNEENQICNTKVKRKRRRMKRQRWYMPRKLPLIKSTIQKNLKQSEEIMTKTIILSNENKDIEIINKLDGKLLNCKVSLERVKPDKISSKNTPQEIVKNVKTKAIKKSGRIVRPRRLEPYFQEIVNFIQNNLDIIYSNDNFLKTQKWTECVDHLEKLEYVVSVKTLRRQFMNLKVTAKRKIRKYKENFANVPSPLDLQVAKLLNVINENEYIEFMEYWKDESMYPNNTAQPTTHDNNTDEIIDVVTVAENNAAPNLQHETIDNEIIEPIISGGNTNDNIDEPINDNNDNIDEPISDSNINDNLIKPVANATANIETLLLQKPCLDDSNLNNQMEYFTVNEHEVVIIDDNRSISLPDNLNNQMEYINVNEHEDVIIDGNRPNLLVNNNLNNQKEYLTVNEHDDVIINDNRSNCLTDNNLNQSNQMEYLNVNEHEDVILDVNRPNCLTDNNFNNQMEYLTVNESESVIIGDNLPNIEMSSNVITGDCIEVLNQNEDNLNNSIILIEDEIKEENCSNECQPGISLNICAKDPTSWSTCSLKLREMGYLNSSTAFQKTYNDMQKDVSDDIFESSEICNINSNLVIVTVIDDDVKIEQQNIENIKVNLNYKKSLNNNLVPLAEAESAFIIRFYNEFNSKLNINNSLYWKKCSDKLRSELGYFKSPEMLKSRYGLMLPFLALTCQKQYNVMIYIPKNDAELNSDVITPVDVLELPFSEVPEEMSRLCELRYKSFELRRKYLLENKIIDDAIYQEQVNLLTKQLQKLTKDFRILTMQCNKKR